MSLSASLSKYKAEVADATSRNLAHSRPASTPRTSTPTPLSLPTSKRTHEAAFNDATPTSATAQHAGTEVFTNVFTAIKYLKEKDGQAIPFDKLIDYLSLPLDARKNIPNIKNGLQTHPQATFIPKSKSDNGRDSFTYRPTHPVRNAEDLKDYLARQPTAQGIKVGELKDGWPDCTAAIDTLEREGSILVLRNKKDNTAKMVWTDSPNFHILNPINQTPQKIDADFAHTWSTTKLPASETDIRIELEKAGLTPTSQVKEIKRVEPKQKEKRRVNRKSGKTTNSHMLGILKDYSKR